jgi:hypothetical protein
VSKADDYEAKALEALALSDQYAGGHVVGAQVYATQAQAYATLALLHRNDDYNEDVELYNTEVEIYNRSHWGSAVWAWLKRK